MKKLLAILLMIPLFASSQIKINVYYDGYWGEWENAFVTTLSGGVDQSLPYTKIYGNYSGFCTYRSNFHPSNYSFKFQINNYYQPDKKTRNEHLKTNKWYEYSGVVEYYINDDLPTMKDIMKAGYALGKFPAVQPDWQGARKRTTNATIQIAPYKDHPKVYNIWFEGVGVGIDLGMIYFPE